ncbi:MAG: hypothetical protein JNL18_14045 [Planctomycetaceae bacterium]|nr:hypothetical protein [Planctomycetaceae bacterium]
MAGIENDPPKEPPSKPSYYYPFGHTAPIPCGAEKKREYDEIVERIVEQLQQRNGATESLATAKELGLSLAGRGSTSR